ncbi:hypothetical protein BDV19DRAFT_355099 [Aspergillus venezuelensis]
MTLSLDVLRMTKHLDGAVPILADHDLENTQVLILDSKEGPYFDLWSLLTGRPTIRMTDPALLTLASSENLIVPLSRRRESTTAGGLGNPHMQ